MTSKGPAVHSSDRIDDALAFQIYRTNRLLLTHLGRFLSGPSSDLAGGLTAGLAGVLTADLTPEKWFVLARIYQDGPMRQGDLNDPQLEDAPNISRLVETLVAGGLVAREVDPRDRRARVIQLTEQGSKLAKQILDSAVDERNRVFAGLSATELRTLSKTLALVDSNVRKMLSPDAGDL